MRCWTRILHRWSIAAAVVAVWCLLGSTPRAAAGTPCAPNGFGRDGQPGPTQVTPAGQVELARLVDLAAQKLRLNIEYDPAALKQAVTLRLAAGMTDQELWALVNRLLASRGFTTVRAAKDSTLSVVKIADAANLVRLLPDDLEPLPGGVQPGFRSAVVRIRHRPVKDVVEALSKFLSKPGGSVQAIGEAGTVVIADLSDRVDQALELLKVLDAPAGQTVVEEVPVAHLDAAALANLVVQVKAKREAVSGDKVPGEVLPSSNANALLLVAPQDRTAYWRELIAGLDRPERVETVGYTPRVFSAKEVAGLVERTIRPDERWRLETDDLTGSLVITATPSQHGQIRDLLARLESSPSETRRPVRSYVIRNRGVKELVEVLEQLVGAGMLGGRPASGQVPLVGPMGTRGDYPPAPGSTGTPSAATATAAGGSTPGASASGPSALGAPNTIGTPGFPGTTPEPPLTLTADEGTNTLIASGDPKLLEQLESLIAKLDVRQPQVMLEVLIISLSEAETKSLSVELQKLTSYDGTAIRLASLFGTGPSGADQVINPLPGVGFTGVALNPGDFAVVVRALQSLSSGQSLSIPKLLVRNNEQAVLDSVLEQPFTSTNASDTVATTSFGGSARAGTQVTIKPQIAEGDHLTLEYQVALSSFVGSAANASVPPPRQENKVQSVATIPDGYTVVVGGIDLETESRTKSQVPIVGDIPLIGEAFKSRSRNESKSKFYVFIRANVLRARGLEDLKYLSDREAGGVGIDDGFPEVEPRLIR